MRAKREGSGTGSGPQKERTSMRGVDGAVVALDAEAVDEEFVMVEEAEEAAVDDDDVKPLGLVGVAVDDEDEFEVVVVVVFVEAA